MLKIETLHHVSLPVSDIDDAKEFYSETLELEEVPRPPGFDFPGAWYRIGDRLLHLIVDNDSTFRQGKEVHSRDIHFAIRVASYRETRDFLRSKGFHPDSNDVLMRSKESPKASVGFPQLYIIDRDRNVIEFNAERLDLGADEMKALGLA